jgi:hypothetical protein
MVKLTLPLGLKPKVQVPGHVQHKADEFAGLGAGLAREGWEISSSIGRGCCGSWVGGGELELE